MYCIYFGLVIGFTTLMLFPYIYWCPPRPHLVSPLTSDSVTHWQLLTLVLFRLFVLSNSPTWIKPKILRCTAFHITVCLFYDFLAWITVHCWLWPGRRYCWISRLRLMPQFTDTSNTDTLGLFCNQCRYQELLDRSSASTRGRSIGSPHGRLLNTADTSPADRPQSEWIWCSQVMAGRSCGLHQLEKGGIPSRTSDATRRTALLSDIRATWPNSDRQQWQTIDWIFWRPDLA